MKKKITQNNNDNFLKKSTSDVTQHHKNYLGTTIPEDYFSKSKSSILSKIKSENIESVFLKEDFTDITEHHKEYLGTAIPKDYFTKSKLSILDKINQEIPQEAQEPKKQLVFYLRPQLRYAVAASLVFLLSLTIWLQNSSNQNEENTISVEYLALENDALLESLLIDDKDVDAFAEATIFNEIMVKAELEEQKLDNLILNSIIVEDSLLDDYIKDELIETVIL